MEPNPTFLSITLVLVFSTVAVGFYLISDYYLDNGFPASFGQACDKSIEDDCAYINSHLNTFNLVHYDADNDCKFTLNAGLQHGARYKLKWKRFGLEGSTNCSKDFLEIYQSGSKALLPTDTPERFCGQENPQYNITHQYVVLRFVSDGGGEDEGFRVMATRTLPAPCFDDYYHCKAENRCIDGRLKCDGTPQCDDETDENDCSFWEKLIGGFLALGVVGIVGVVFAVFIGCTGICVTICICTCCRHRCDCRFKGCSNCWGHVCTPCKKLAHNGTVAPKDETSVENVSKETLGTDPTEKTKASGAAADQTATITRDELPTTTHDV